jgi:CAAX protease family protein
VVTRTARTARPGGPVRAVSWVAGIEVLLAAAAVLLDLLIPSLVLLAMAGLSLLARREGPSSLGLWRPHTPRLGARMLLFAAAWSAFQLAVAMPVVSHVSGTEQDLGIFEDVEGDLGLLVILLLASWTLGAVVEEVAYRGYLLTRLRELTGRSMPGLVVAVLVSSVLFGVAHSEQGLVGVAAVTLDAVAFCLLRLRYDTVWAPVLAHGWNNTIGLVAFFLVGPVSGPW